MIPDFKICSMCKVNKPKTDYHTKTEKRGYVYLKSRCKECSRQSRYYDFCECGDKKQKRSKNCKNCKADRSLRLIDCKKRYEAHSAASYGALVRDRARKRYRKSDSKCQSCGYSKHVEICHIKPVSEFSLDTLIDDINAPDNILILCPNCHWEFDHKKLTIDRIACLGNAPSLSL